jgi:hypothetical protein
MGGGLVVERLVVPACLPAFLVWPLLLLLLLLLVVWPRSFLHCVCSLECLSDGIAMGKRKAMASRPVDSSGCVGGDRRATEDDIIHASLMAAALEPTERRGFDDVLVLVHSLSLYVI